VLVRQDLTPAQQLCQAVHAAHEAGIRFGNPSGISSVVICTVPDQVSLLEAQQRLQWKGIQCYTFNEPDLGNQSTALATEPIARGARKVLSYYPLWKESPVSMTR
jgi:hypothetical protein